MNIPISRRQFISRSAALATGPLILPATVWGENQPSNRITVGCIGVRGVGLYTIRWFLPYEDCRIVALCDVDRQILANRVDAINEYYGDEGCRSYTDYRELLAQDDIDAVIIATPDHWHATMAMAALKAGKDIYCEKPLTHTHEEGVRLIRAVKQHDCIWQTGAWQRSNFHFRRTAELAQNGVLGEIQSIEIGLPSGNPHAPADDQFTPPEHVDYDAWCGPSPLLPYHPDRFHVMWRFNYHFGGGQLMDWIGHHNDIAHWAIDEELGGPIAVQMDEAFYPRETAVWDTPWQYSVTSWYEKGFTIRISNQAPQGLTILGSEGWVHVSRGEPEFNLVTMRPEWARPEFDPGSKKLYVSEHHARNFLDCIRSRKPAITPAESAHRCVTPGHLALISAALGNKRIEWDPVTETILNDEEGSKLLTQQGDRMPWMPWREAWAGDLLHED